MALKKAKATRAKRSQKSSKKISKKDGGAKSPVKQEQNGTPSSDAITRATNSTLAGPETAQDVDEHQMLTEFTIFSDLPLEIRLHIWGLGAPEGAIVVQRESQNPGRRFVYHRCIPAVLHACRESRAEYLETNDPTDKTLQRRQRHHPVYKLHFQEGTARSMVGKPGAFFSPDVDTFCGTRYRGKTAAHPSIHVSYSRWYFNFYSGIGDLSIAESLKHLAVNENAFDITGFKTIKDTFPALESLTLLVVFNPSLPPVTDGVRFEQEVDGQLNELTLSSLPSYYRNTIRARIMTVKAAVTGVIETNPTKRFPDIKWRFMDQVIPELPAIQATASGETDEE